MTLYPQWSKLLHICQIETFTFEILKGQITFHCKIFVICCHFPRNLIKPLHQSCTNSSAKNELIFLKHIPLEQLGTTLKMTENFFCLRYLSKRKHVVRIERCRFDNKNIESNYHSVVYFK